MGPAHAWWSVGKGLRATCTLWGGVWGVWGLVNRTLTWTAQWPLFLPTGCMERPVRAGICLAGAKPHWWTGTPACRSYVLPLLLPLIIYSVLVKVCLQQVIFSPSLLLLAWSALPPLTRWAGHPPRVISLSMVRDEHKCLFTPLQQVTYLRGKYRWSHFHHPTVTNASIMPFCMWLLTGFCLFVSLSSSTDGVWDALKTPLLSNAKFRSLGAGGGSIQVYIVV